MKNLIFILLLINMQCVAQNSNNMKDNINVTFSGGQEKNIINGIIPAILTIKNNTNKEIFVLLFYPNPNDISFDCQQPFVEKKNRGWNLSEENIPIKIQSGETYKNVYFLGRYFKFLKDGKFDIIYDLELSAGTGNTQSESISYKGNFPIQISSGSNEELKKQLSYYSENLKSDNRKIKEESAEALSFVENPLSVDYITPMLSIENLETKGIDALSKFNTPQNQKLISKMLSHRESDVVSKAIEALHKMKVEIPRKEFISMLASENTDIVFLGLENLEKNPNKNDMGLVKPVLNSLNDTVAEKAKGYYDLLEKMK
ncbi:HEAT repeat domain-containing protein [Chryseobacterium vrystaatense]|uniref:HEAT repeat domain-containing protein n=1 Tax=Chryseobacterium vrystaatense TaxID=307480 RepID=A0ABR4UG18_9FLAO|nr:HEAT repeat domain-containing protein [Chryseobacterium vrystaatense]KFF23417.1 hypothetical protein IW16_24410 [Chryseobacterium vrystaatense]